MLLVRAGTVFVISFNIAMCAAVIFFRVLDGGDNLHNVLLAQSVVALTLVLTHSAAWFRQGGGDLSLAYVFFLMVFIFNCGKSLLFVFYPFSSISFFTFFNENDYQLIVQASEYSLVGMLVLSSAMLLTQYTKAPQQVAPTNIQLFAAQLTGGVFMLVSVPAAIIDLQAMLLLVLQGGYFALYSTEQTYGAAGIVKVLSYFLFPSLFISIIAFRKNKALVYAIIIFAVIYTLVRLAMGGRLNALIPFIVLMSLWDVTIRRLNRTFIYATSAIMISIVFPALSVFRTGVGEATTPHESGSGLFNIIKEMSDSIGPLAWTIQRVPTDYDFLYGHSFYLALTTAMPNFFWDVHPAKEGSLAKWLVHEVNPWIAEAGGGYGFSIFAEMYLNFNWFGMLALFVVGYFTTRLAIVKTNPINTAFCFACFIGLMLWPRGEVLGVGRFILWHVGIPWLFYHAAIFAFGRFR
ncbi:O-antigen polysaccharide polymerase Wzy [Ningiella sp. W23]|uniref:O-antigen polysaccharide polymerase Wzy n=1 Tax=Ningiella sp. W23 TaxID=3023715 RepID=UPI003757615F